MKKIFAVILTFIYVLSALPAFSSCQGCEGDCEVKQVKTEDHQRTMTASFKLEPLAPVLAASNVQVQMDDGVVTGTGPYIFLFSNKIPLFLRHCNFRI